MKDKRWQGKWIYIDFLCKTKSGKTAIYKVMADTDYRLGDIKWYAPWRKYTFFPEPNTIYEQDCLRDIVEFLDEIK